MTLNGGTPDPTDSDGGELLDELEASLVRYVILPSPEALAAVTLWIAATHAAQAWNTAPRLLITGPEKRCGKSRLLDIVEATCHRPVMTVNASPSAIYRLIGAADGDPPTVLIDEADTIFGPAAGEHEDLRGLLNAGHQRNRPALRWDVNTRSVEELDTYAMAALAGIGRFPDTIQDRAVIIKMRRRAPNEMVLPYRIRRDAPPLNRLRFRLHQWALTNLDQLTTAQPDMPLEDRAADTWEALIAVADIVGSSWPQRGRNAALVLTEQAQDDDDGTIPTQLLADIQRALDGRQQIRTPDLLLALKADTEAPWASHGPTGLTARSMAVILKEFGIKACRVTIDGTQQRGYAANDFLDAWARYLPTPTPSEVSQVSEVSNPQVSPVDSPRHFCQGDPSRSAPGVTTDHQHRQPRPNQRRPR